MTRALLGRPISRAASKPLCVQLLPDTHSAGAENQARYLTAELARRPEVDVEFAYFDPGRTHDEFEALGVPLRRIPRRHRLRYDLILRTRRIRRSYGSGPPDLMHTWLMEANVFGLLAARSWPHTGLVISQRGSWNELDYPLHDRLQRLLIGRADHAISNSEGGAHFLERQGMPVDRISVIPNGIPDERVDVGEPREAVRERLGWHEDDVIAWVGRTEDPAAMAQKDFATLLGAVSRLRESRPTARLALIGLTAEEARTSGFQLPEWAQSLGWTVCPADLINASDLLAVSSRAEGHSNVAGEALLLGLPVVSTDCGGHCSLVEEAGGRVTPVGDPQALGAAIGELLDTPPQRARVRSIATVELSVERMAERTIAVYEQVLARRSVGPVGP